jgi:hypothetical protein
MRFGAQALWIEIDQLFYAESSGIAIIFSPWHFPLMVSLSVRKRSILGGNWTFLKINKLVAQYMILYCRPAPARSTVRAESYSAESYLLGVMLNSVD